MKLEVFEHLLRMNAGFDQAIRSLTALRKHGGFRGDMLALHPPLFKETRAEPIVPGDSDRTSETKEAGGGFRKRKAQERADEQRG